MCPRRKHFLSFLGVMSCLVVVLAVLGQAHAATLTVINLDGPGEGFNDTTPFTPVAGNPATTVGQARPNVFQVAANVWGGVLTSSVQIRIGARFDPLTRTPTSAILGPAGPTTVHRDFPGAPVASTWYVQAQANALAGMDLAPGTDDISATFNSVLNGSLSCLGGTGWYYGLDGQPGGAIDFFSVVLHEIGHGLGFLIFVNLNTGSKFMGLDDAYMRHLENYWATPPDFPSMTDAQRATAMRAGPNLHWTGAQVVAISSILTGGRHPSGHVQMYAPGTVAPGSSVSHWDTALFPNQLMEPFDTGPKPAPGALELALLKDLGWNGGGTRPTLTVQLNQSAFRSGQTLTLQATLTPGTTPTPVDVYVVVRLPNGSFFSLLLDGRIVSGIVPIATGFTPFPFMGELLRFPLNAGLPLGSYAWLCALTQPGTLTFPVMSTLYKSWAVRRCYPMAWQPQTLLSPEEYLAIERHATGKSEYFAGEIFAMAGASRRHNLIVAHVIRVPGNQLLESPCNVYPSDIGRCFYMDKALVYVC